MAALGAFSRPQYPTLGWIPNAKLRIQGFLGRAMPQPIHQNSDRRRADEQDWPDVFCEKYNENGEKKHCCEWPICCAVNRKRARWNKCKEGKK